MIVFLEPKTKHYGLLSISIFNAMSGNVFELKICQNLLNITFDTTLTLSLVSLIVTTKIFEDTGDTLVCRIFSNFTRVPLHLRKLEKNVDTWAQRR